MPWFDDVIRDIRHGLRMPAPQSRVYDGCGAHAGARDRASRLDPNVVLRDD